jgi:hypothetical protein
MSNTNHVSTGTVEGTGSAISVICGFKPKAVLIHNVDGEASLYWDDTMTDAYGYKVNDGTMTGTAAAQTFTGTAATAAGAVAFSGTGQSSSGQVITTTDNQTMTLNQCAGMWLIQATGATPPNLILSNTAVTGAPAVLTVQGSANTDAGTYKIVQNTSGTGAVQLSTLGITPIFNGFTIGADTDLNLVLSTLHWTAWK